MPSHVQYACQYWIDHLQKGDLSLLDVRRVYEFFKTHFLHWLEALSLISKLSEAVLMIKILDAKNEASIVLKLLYITGADASNL